MSSRSAMTLRIVAGDRPRICRRAIAREPTGSAVRTYSAMTATNTSRLRVSRTSTAIAMLFYTAWSAAFLEGRSDGSEQLDEKPVREQEARFGEVHPLTVIDEEALLLPG